LNLIMTTTVKLPHTLEDSLRERCTSEGRSISEVMRDALVMYLATAPKGVASAFELGQDLFGRSYAPGLGIMDLASNRKAHAASVWDEVAKQKMPGASGAGA
jgi:Arc/MetJ-type ribon-helix-helix transcriptional regulator